MRATRAIIHLDNLKKNIRAIKSLCEEKTKLCIPVKADAYGHGAVPCAKAAIEAGADVLAVATVDEGIELRQNGITLPLLLFSLCSKEEMDALVSFHIMPFVCDSEYIQLVADAARNAGERNFPVHLAVDTGMGRIGCMPEEAAVYAKEIVQTSVLSLGGVCTHFAVSDGISKNERLFTQVQFSRFTDAIESIKREGIDPGICHCANSATTLESPEMHLDMVRPGIIVYGYYAGEVSQSYLASKGIAISLEPVMTLETEVSAVRSMKRGASIGYGRTWTAENDTEIAVLPVGYGDGVLRSWSTGAVSVAIHGTAYPIRGRICMDQCMIELGKQSGIKRGDKAVFFGCASDGALQTAEEIASRTDTISYEITTCLSKRVPRFYIS